MKKAILYFLLIIFTVNNSITQSKTINIHFLAPSTNKEITVRHSIKDLLNYFYEPYIQRYEISGSTISLVIPDSIFFTTFSADYNWSGHVPLYMKNDEILNIYLDSINPPVFEGERANFHHLMFELKNKGGWDRSTKSIDEFLENDSDTSFYEFIKGKINQDTTRLEKLLMSNYIDKDAYLFAKNLIIDEYLYRIGSIGGSPEEKYLQKMDDNSFYSDIDRLYEEFTLLVPFQISLQGKAQLRGFGFIPGEKLDLGYDYGSNPAIYLNKEEQEVNLARTLIEDVSVGLYTPDQLFQKRMKFKQIFPNSIYNSILDELVVSEEKDGIFAYYSIGNGLQEFGRIEAKDISEILQMIGNTPVLVDIWATWCSPCLKQFRQKTELDIYLKENNIQSFFVSVDLPGAYDRWKETIVRNKLEGFHYLSVKNFYENQSFYNGSIPQYVLFDEKGQVLIPSCEYPSSGKLIPQIKEALD